jgi:hypothetical protein
VNEKLGAIIPADRTLLDAVEGWHMMGNFNAADGNDLSQIAPRTVASSKRVASLTAERLRKYL